MAVFYPHKIPKSQKVKHLLDLDGDIYAIQECSKKSIDEIFASGNWSGAWFGKNPNKGLGILVRHPWKIVDAAPANMNLAARVQITGPVAFEMYAVWASRGVQIEGDYIRQIHKMLDGLEKTKISSASVIMGDFNSNSIWDQKHRTKTHTEAVERLANLGLQSAYHVFNDELQGKEKQPTLFHMKDRKKLYHIDYVFLSSILLQGLMRVRVGSCDDWISLSDHVPLVVDIDNSAIGHC